MLASTREMRIFSLNVRTLSRGLILTTLLLLSTFAQAHSDCSEDTPNTTDALITQIEQSLELVEQNSLRKASLELAKQLDKKAPDIIPRSETLDLQMLVRTLFRSQFLRGYEGYGRNSAIPVLLEERFERIFHQLLQSGKLRYLTSQSKENLGISQYLCKEAKSEKCKEMRAFYLPLTGHVYIDKDLPKEAQARALFHELLHAYQFTYRYPLDIAKLDAFSKTGEIAKDQVRKFLDYYYESQANWQTMKAAPEAPWESHYKDPVEKEKATVGGAICLTVLAPICGPIMLLTGPVSSMYMNGYLPDVAKFPLSQAPGFERKHAALDQPELIPLENTNINFGLGGNIDLDFHRKFGKAVEKTYFGNIPFLFRKTSEDLLITNSLHNQYYERLGLSKTVDTDPSCQKLLEKIYRSNTSPMVEWLTIPQEQLQSCSVYKDISNTLDRNDFAKRQLEHIDHDSPFILSTNMGGEGSTPDLRVVPEIPILPQLVVSPQGAQK